MKEEEKQELSRTIGSFLDGSCGEWDWDDFISIRSKIPEIQLIKDFCADSSFLYPPVKTGHWCNKLGLQRLAELSRLIRTGTEADVRSFVETEMRNAEQSSRGTLKSAPHFHC
jgi:hypothetical protein